MKIKRNSALCLITFITSLYVLFNNANNVIVLNTSAFIAFVSIILFETFLIIDNE